MVTANLSGVLPTDFYNRSVLDSFGGPRTSPRGWLLLPAGDAWAVVWMAIATCLTTVGNSAICWIICSTPPLLNTHNKFVLSLAVCDLLMGVLNGPQTIIALVYDRWVLGIVMCQINGFLTTLFGVASVITLASISLNRCYMIAYATKGSRVFTQRRTNAIILGVWLFSILCSFPPIFGWSKYVYIPSKAICTIRWSASVSYTIVVILFGVCAPFVVMVAAYFRIFRKVRESNRRIGQSLQGLEANAAIKNGSVGNTSSEFTETRFHQVVVASAAAAAAADADGGRISVTTGSRLGFYDSNLRKSEFQLGNQGRVSRNPIPMETGKWDSGNVNPGDTVFKSAGGSGCPPPKQTGESDASGAVPDQSGGSLDHPRFKLSQRLSFDILLQTTPEEIQNSRSNKSLGEPQEFVQQEVSDIRSMSLDSSAVRALAGDHPGGVPQSLSVNSLLTTVVSHDLQRPAGMEHTVPATLLRMARMRKRTSALSAAFKRNSLPKGGAASTSRFPTRNSCRTSRGSASVRTVRSCDDFRSHLERSRRTRIADEIKVSLTLLVVIVLFAVSWAPISLVNCIETFHLANVPRSVDRLAVCMMFLQPAINPILYGAMNKNFRGGFDSILKFLFCIKATDSTNP